METPACPHCPHSHHEITNKSGNTLAHLPSGCVYRVQYILQTICAHHAGTFYTVKTAEIALIALKKK